MKKLTLAIASDHAGVEHKQYLIKNLPNYNWNDLGPNTNDSVDYPDFACLVGQSLQSNVADLGILICGSGIGMSIAANKMSGIRAAHSESVETARLCREHNDANILCLGARITSLPMALEMVKTWLKSEFQKGRHSQRIEKISKLEKGYLQ